jgi:hypothetical protein
MSAPALVARLLALGVGLRLDAEGLVLRGPKTAFADGFLAEIRSKKTV